MTDPNDSTIASPGGWRRYRTELIVLGIFILFPALIFFGMRRDSVHIAGFYLVAGGHGYLLIEPSVVGYEVQHFSMVWGYSPALKWKVKTRGGLRLESEAGASHAGSTSKAIIHLRGSSAHPGDFDLLEIEDRTYPSAWYGKILDAVRNVFPRRALVASPPMLSYLHRVQDASAQAYMELARKEPQPLYPGRARPVANINDLFQPGPQVSQMVSLARAAHQRNPHDLYLRVLLLDALARALETDELTKLLNEWDADFKSAPPEAGFAVSLFQQLQRKARSLLALRRGKNGYPLILAALSPDTPLPEVIATIANIRESEALSTPGGVTSIREEVMDFLRAQTSAKTSGIYVWFKLLHGDVDGAMDLALGRLRLGQLLPHFDTYIITKLIGIAIRAMSAMDLQRIAVNAPLTLEQCDRLTSELLRLVQEEPLSDEVNLRDGEYPVDVPTSYRTNFGETKNRHDIAATRLRLALLMAMARRELTANGELHPPMSGPGRSRWEKLDSLLTDPFSYTTAPHTLRTILTSQTLIGYSVGPDRTDDSTSIEYDVTNGTTSQGDISAVLRRTPQYPLPVGGVVAQSTETVAALFPEGLPPDVYANRRPFPLSMAQTSDTVIVYSFGPDTDQQEVERLGAAYLPTTQYDPTNGTISKGDLITTLARTRDELITAP